MLEPLCANGSALMFFLGMEMTVPNVFRGGEGVVVGRVHDASIVEQDVDLAYSARLRERANSMSMWLKVWVCVGDRVHIVFSSTTSHRNRVRHMFSLFRMITDCKCSHTP